MKRIKHFWQSQSVVIKQLLIIIPICLIILIFLDIIQNRQLTIRLSDRIIEPN